MPQFDRIELRTTDADAARSFYQNVLGHDRAVIWPLHEQALARGARPHWLGHIGVTDVEATSEAFVKRGATQIGPIRPTSEGGRAAVLRDPGGAIVAVSALPKQDEGQLAPVWHVLNCTDAERARETYRDLFGWSLGDRFDLGEHGTFQRFSWRDGEPTVGAIGDIGGRPGVHAHWIFFFEVASLETALDAVRAGGGLALEPMVTPRGDRVCVCDNPQGAAFALQERRG